MMQLETVLKSETTPEIARNNTEVSLTYHLKY